MNEIRDYEKEAISIKKRFPEWDLSRIRKMVKESPNIEHVIQSIQQYENLSQEKTEIHQDKSYQLSEQIHGSSESSILRRNSSPSNKTPNCNGISELGSNSIVISQPNNLTTIPNTNDQNINATLLKPTADEIEKSKEKFHYQSKPPKYPTTSHPKLTLPNEFQNIKPNINRFGSFGGPINSSSTSSTHTSNYLSLNYSSSSSTSSLNLYTSPPSSYNKSVSTTISLSSEENQFESYQQILKKDVPTQLNNVEQGTHLTSNIYGNENTCLNCRSIYDADRLEKRQEHISSQCQKCSQSQDQSIDRSNPMDQISHDPKFMEPQAQMFSNYYQCSNPSRENC